MTAFSEFGIIVSLAAFFAILATKMRQPAILGYIVAGVIIKATSHAAPDHEQIELFSKLGITLLLFVLGLELNISELKSLGRVAIVTGLGQIFASSMLGFLLSKLLGFSFLVSGYIAIGLTFSSTIVVIKLLSLKKQQEHLYGRISIGFLLVQDFVAMIIIILLSAIGNLKGETGFGAISSQLGITMLKGIGVGIFVYFFVKFILNPLLNNIRSEKEVLFLTVLAWAFILASLMGSKQIGFSIEIGGLMAGIALSNRFEHLQIESWTKPLRDFFLMLFFVLLGLELHVDSIGGVLVPALIFSAFVLITKPVIVMFILRRLKYASKTSFLTAISIAQVSEFSLIVGKFGLDIGHLDNNTLALLTIAGGITMTISSYMIFYGEELYEFCQKTFNWKKMPDDDVILDDTGSIIVFGCHRMGRNILRFLPKYKEGFLVIDNDPKVIKNLKEDGYQSVFGDISDVELYSSFLQKAEIVVSTIPSLKENRKLLQHVNQMEKKPMILITANDDDAAKQLYEAGVDFVIYPHMLGAEIISSIIGKGVLTKNVVGMRSKQMTRLGLT
jgi:Kef-type K+ transport system membrane component KefB